MPWELFCLLSLVDSKSIFVQTNEKKYFCQQFWGLCCNFFTAVVYSVPW
jgi:hypothetical protein